MVKRAAAPAPFDIGESVVFSVKHRNNSITKIECIVRGFENGLDLVRLEWFDTTIKANN